MSAGIRVGLEKKELRGRGLEELGGDTPEELEAARRRILLRRVGGRRGSGGGELRMWSWDWARGSVDVPDGAVKRNSGTVAGLGPLLRCRGGRGGRPRAGVEVQGRHRWPASCRC